MSDAIVPFSRLTTHQLSNGLYVSGRPDHGHKEKVPTMRSTSMPYTGGDIKKSGELGKMFEIPVDEPPETWPTPPQSGPGSVLTRSLSRSSSGPITSVNLASRSSKHSNSGPLPSSANDPELGRSRASVSGQLVPLLPATGLLTSGPLSSSGAPLSQGQSGGFVRANQAITNLSNKQTYLYRSSYLEVILCTITMLLCLGFIVGGVLHNFIMLIIMGSLFIALIALLIWNGCSGKRLAFGFISSLPDAHLNHAQDGQYVKITGIVNCSTVYLESSFQKMNRCVYTSAELVEYRGMDSKPVNEKQRRFTWATRHVERHVVDFFVSDLQSGIIAMVKAGNGAHVTPYVEERTVVEILPTTGGLPTDFVTWLMKRNLSAEDRVMRLTEGYIQEGNTVTVLGVVKRDGNCLTIVPPPQPVSTGCQWYKCLLPSNLEGLIIRCDEASKANGSPV